MSDERQVHKVTFDVAAFTQRLARQRAISFDDIERLLDALEAEREQRIKERADMLSLLGWVCDCWPNREDNWFRPDMDDCVEAIRKFLGPRVPAPEEGQ